MVSHIFDAIHNGPLQTLACLQRYIQDQSVSTEQVVSELERLNRELRMIFDSVHLGQAEQDHYMTLSNGSELNLNYPLHELLYTVYCNTLKQDFPHFQSVKLRVTAFEQMNDRLLNLHQKHSLCRFLEEALCNVGKYALRATRLEVICKHEHDQNVIRIIDNGVGKPSSLCHSPGGYGTKQAKILAHQLKGWFRRSPNLPDGTICELGWWPEKLFISTVPTK
jgi:two-component sensor histidine kinase